MDSGMESSIERNNQDVGCEETEEEEITFQLYSDADPDLKWIIDTAAFDDSSTCDHSDHEHVMQSSSSESIDDMDLLRDCTSSIVVAANKNINAIYPQRSLSIEKVPQEPISRDGAPSDVASESLKKPMATSPQTSPFKIPRQQTNHRLKKINGDDTILNLFAATVAKAVTPPPPPRKQEQTKAAIAPDVTSPYNKKPRVIFPRASQSIRPEVSKPMKKVTTVPLSPTSINNTGNSTRDTSASNQTMDIKSKAMVKEPTPLPQPKLPSSESDALSSPLTKVWSIATGNAMIPARIQIELSDHDEEDAIFESYSSKVAVTAPSPKSHATNVDIVKRISSTSLLEVSPDIEQQQQQYLHLEIAKELDEGNSSRRFQLAIQSNMSSLTLGTFTDHEIDADDLSISGATFCDRYSVTSGYNDDDEESKVTMNPPQPPPLPPVIVASDDEIEVPLEDRTIELDETKHDAPKVGLTKSPKEEKSMKILPPALLTQKSHSWVRNRLWGQQPPPPQLYSSHSKIQDVVDASGQTRCEITLSSISLSNEQSLSDKHFDVDDSDSSIDCPTPSPACAEKNHSPLGSPDTGTMDCTRWEEGGIAFYCLFYIIPFTSQAGTNLPHIYFLIELVDVYETNLYLAGIYLCISLTMRYAMHSISLQTPRLAAVGGTVSALTGYLLLLLINKIEGIQFSPESNIVNACLFIFGSIIVGFNETTNCVNTIVRDVSRKSSISNHVDSDCKTQALISGWEAQLNVIQLSTIICYAMGGVIYEYYDISGIAVAGVALLLLQLISLLIVVGTERTKQSISHELRQLTRSSSSSIPNFFQSDSSELDVSSSSNNTKCDCKLRKNDHNRSFRSIVTPELETIEEAPAAESESDDDPNSKLSYFDADRSDQRQSTRQSFVSSSSTTPEHDNRCSSKQDYSNLYGQNSEQFPSELYETMINNHIQPLQWEEIFVVIAVAVQPLLNGLVFGTGTLLLFEEFNQDKSTVGYIYAASSLCGIIPYLIPKSFLDFYYFERFNMYGTLYLIGTTYMILLTAISSFSTYIVGVLSMKLLLGFFAKSMNEVQCRLMLSNNKNNERIMPHLKWIRFICSILATLLSPILYDVLPRLPNMSGSGICFAMTAVIWFGSEASNKDEDGEKTKVNITTETEPSEAIDGLMQQQGTDATTEVKVTMQRIRFESLIGHTI